jgi:hypothetical protein
VTSCAVCTVHKETRSASFLVEPQNQGRRFLGLDHKIDNSSLMIEASKSPRRFLDLGNKIKQSSVCRLCHKTDGGRLVRDKRKDLADCFTWKQVVLGFPSLTSKLVEARLQVVHVASSRRLRGVEAKDGWVDVTSCVGRFYPKIIVFYMY